ncbi:hypothetical protein B0T16DRAFT_142251 [Cercophora newfieldiana]|uniref:Uncharacterized protein n=1 Tax=Cercophora newfieldiana TaxID=92897 RepID=A0AA39Y3Y2_9PEZI|nr:hypothetical protein B0T16DRAFT_142251 [Cercophora newfieldiana]
MEWQRANNNTLPLQIGVMSCAAIFYFASSGEPTSDAAFHVFALRSITTLILQQVSRAAPYAVALGGERGPLGRSPGPLLPVKQGPAISRQGARLERPHLRSVSLTPEPPLQPAWTLVNIGQISISVETASIDGVVVHQLITQLIGGKARGGDDLKRYTRMHQTRQKQYIFTSEVVRPLWLNPTPPFCRCPQSRTNPRQAVWTTHTRATGQPHDDHVN